MLEKEKPKFKFLQLNEEIQQLMIDEINLDVDIDHVFKSPRFIQLGSLMFADLIKDNIKSGDDITLSKAIKQYINKSGKYTDKNGKERTIPRDAHYVLGQGQFNYYYSRAICSYAIKNKIETVEIYRAKYSSNPRSESQSEIGKHRSAIELLENLRKNDFVNNTFNISKPNSGLSVKY